MTASRRHPPSRPLSLDLLDRFEKSIAESVPAKDDSTKIFKGASTPAEAAKLVNQHAARGTTREKHADVGIALAELLQSDTLDPEAFLFSNGKLNINALTRRLRKSVLVTDKTVAKYIHFLQEYAKVNEAMDDRSQLEELIAELRKLSTAWSDDEEDGVALREDIGFRAIDLVRIIVNLIVLDGRSRSLLPSEANLEEDERRILHLLATQKNVMHDDPVAKLLESLIGFQKTGGLHLLGTRAARAAIAIFGDSIAGLHAQLNVQFLLRPVLGEAWFVSEMVALAEKVEAVDVDEALEQVRTSPRLMSPSELLFATQFNAAFALANAIAIGESKNIHADERRMNELVEAATTLRDFGTGFPNYDLHQRDLRYLTLETTAVSAFVIGRPEAISSCETLLNDIGQAGSQELVKEIEEGERFDSLRKLVRTAFEHTFQLKRTS